MGVEKDVRRRRGRIVDRRSWHDHERWRTRELNPDVHTDSYLRRNRDRDGYYEQRTECDSLHGLLRSSADAGSRPVPRSATFAHPSVMRFTQRSMPPRLDKPPKRPALAPPNSRGDYGTVIVVPSPLAVMENVPVLLDVYV